MTEIPQALPSGQQLREVLAEVDGDFKEIADLSQPYYLWRDALADRIHDLYGEEELGRVVLLGIADDTNRIMHAVADRLSGPTYSSSNWYVPAMTEKVRGGYVKPTSEANELMVVRRPSLVLAVGAAAVRKRPLIAAAKGALAAGAGRVEALSTYSTLAEHEELVGRRVVHNSVIFEEAAS